MSDRKTFVYTLFNGEDELLYVGMSSNLMTRISGHLRSQPWADEIATVGVSSHPSRALAEKVEADLIKEGNPKYNKKNGICRSEFLGFFPINQFSADERVAA